MYKPLAQIQNQKSKIPAILNIAELMPALFNQILTFCPLTVSCVYLRKTANRPEKQSHFWFSRAIEVHTALIMMNNPELTDSLMLYWKQCEVFGGQDGFRKYDYE